MKRNFKTGTTLRSVFRSRVLIAGLACISLMASCDDDDDDAPAATPSTSSSSSLDLSNLSGLEDLGADFVYEGWIIVNSAPVSTGTFSVNASGALSKSTFSVDKADLAAATRFVLSIEPAVDPDPAPAPTKILVGDFSGSTAMVGTGTVSSAGFSGVAGDYILATPTNSDTTDEYSGIWFLNNSSGSAAVGLTLPALEAGWKYEGWAVINGTPVSTGTFTTATGADEASPFSTGGPAFPGEDFLMNAPAGLTFPVDLRGGNAVISIEPDPDNSPMPFTLKPLAGMIPNSLMAHTVASMNDNVSGSFPSGWVSR